MKYTLIIDLDKKYIEEKLEELEILKSKYNVIFWNGEEHFLSVQENCEKQLVISDDERALEKWKEQAVLAVEHGRRIYGVPYVVDGLENVDEEYLNMVYARKFGIPLIIRETKHLVLREITEEDAEFVCALYENENNVRFLPPIHSLQEEKELIQAYIKNMYGFYGYGMWVVIQKSDNRLIGRAGIENRMIDGKVFHEIGYFIDKAYQGLGYGLEAAGGVLEAAKELAVEELIAYIHKKNTPSISLAQKLGFHFWKESMDGDDCLIYCRRL